MYPIVELTVDLPVTEWGDGSSSKKEKDWPLILILV
jgi:hypothetical protein